MPWPCRFTRLWTATAVETDGLVCLIQCGIELLVFVLRQEAICQIGTLLVADLFLLCHQGAEFIFADAVQIHTFNNAIQLLFLAVVDRL